MKYYLYLHFLHEVVETIRVLGEIATGFQDLGQRLARVPC